MSIKPIMRRMRGGPKKEGSRAQGKKGKLKVDYFFSTSKKVKYVIC